LKKFKVEPNWEQIIESLIVRQEWDGLRFLMDLVLPHQVPLFNKIIVGCGYARNVDAAIEAYERLISLKMEPTNHTLAVIVDALGCNHRFPLALRYWNEMTDPKGKHRIKPQANAYTSIIEACGSAGQIAKAFDIITQAVHDPHAGVDNKLVRNFLASVLRNNGVEPGPTQWDDFLDPGLLDHKLTKPELHALATALPVWREIVRTHANAIHEARHQHHQHRAEQQHPPSSN
jgi:pentatricopeptide repeat protein